MDKPEAIQWCIDNDISFRYARRPSRLSQEWFWEREEHHKGKYYLEFIGDDDYFAIHEWDIQNHDHVTTITTP